MLRILDITAPDINNGVGCRVTIWVSGCKHHCPGCHNSWTWDLEQGLIYRDEMGKVKKILSEWLSRDYISGLTLSGGDPLCQDEDGLNELIELVEWVKDTFNDKNIWIYSGYRIEDLNDTQRTLVELCDVMVDGRYVEELRDIQNYPFRGSSNQRIINIH